MHWLRPWVAGAAALLLAAVALLLLRVDGRSGTPSGPDRLVQQADADADPASVPADASLAQRVLASRPIDGRAFRLLARIAVAQGEQDRADALHGIAARRAPRDRLTRAALADRAFARGDTGEGIAQLDALMRIAPGLRDELLLRLAPHLGDDALQRALVEHVAASPNWRPHLASVLVAMETDTRAGETLLARLAARTTLSPQELAARVTLLQRLQRPTEARQVWLAALDARDRAGADADADPDPDPDPAVFDGGFEHPDVAGGYGWRIGSPPGIDIAYATHDAAEGNSALWLHFEGRAVERLEVEQWLALPAGTWRLEFAANNATDSSRPFVWEIVCQATGASFARAQLPAAASRPQWEKVSVVFAVPTDCTGQLLRLRHLARSLVERRLTGALGIDAMRITAVASLPD